jgi:hypothetical protein
MNRRHPGSAVGMGRVQLDRPRIIPVHLVAYTHSHFRLTPRK